jgi:hypothetical protein
MYETKSASGETSRASIRLIAEDETERRLDYPLKKENPIWLRTSLSIPLLSALSGVAVKHIHLKF